MKHFTKQNHWSLADRFAMGAAVNRWFALLTVLLLMLLAPVRSGGQNVADDSYVAVHDRSSSTVTLKKRTTESVGGDVYEVKDKMPLLEIINRNHLSIKTIIIDESFKTFTPTTLESFFDAFTILETIQGLEYLNTSKVKNIEGMFRKCYKLTKFDIEKLNVAGVTTIKSMFVECRSLISIDLTGFDTSQVKDMSYMFLRCDNLETINLSGFDTSNTERMDYMFYSCPKLENIYVSELFTTKNLENGPDMFYGCTSLPNFDPNVVGRTHANYGEGGYFTYLPPYTTARAVYNTKDKVLSLRSFAVSMGENEQVVANLCNPSGNANWFNGEKALFSWPDEIEKNATSVVIDPSFKTYAIPTCEGMFWYFTALKSIKGLENLNFSNVENMNNMFSNCSALASIDVSGLNTANVTQMEATFCGCSSLTSIDVTNFNTAKVVDMYKMFSGCSSLTSLDLSSFDTGNVDFLDDMLSYCSNLTTVYVSDKFVLTGLYIPENNMNIFHASEKLKGAATYSWAYGNSGVEYANYKTGYLTKLVARNGGEKIGAVGETLTATGNVALSDDKDFVSYDNFKASAVTYSRTMAAGTTWASLCLPFDVSLQGQNFRAFKIVSLGGDKVELEELQGSITAKTPVIIKMNDGQTKFNFSLKNKWIAAGEPAISATADGNCQLVGLFAKKVFDRDTDDNCYIVKGNKLMNPAKILDGTSTTSVGSKAFRAYLVDNTSTSAGAKSLGFGDEGSEPTGIDQLLDKLNDSTATYYDLQGHRLDGPQKGVNIVKRGGKTMKVVIR